MYYAVWFQIYRSQFRGIKANLQTVDYSSNIEYFAYLQNHCRHEKSQSYQSNVMR
jgi:hypothetical protein